MDDVTLNTFIDDFTMLSDMCEPDDHEAAAEYIRAVGVARHAQEQQRTVQELAMLVRRLRSFALAIVCYDDHYFEDCDGGYIQATAVKYGIAYKVTMEAPCGEYCACADTILYDEWPLECYRIAPEILAAKGE